MLIYLLTVVKLVICPPRPLVLTREFMNRFRIFRTGPETFSTTVYFVHLTIPSYFITII